MADTRSLLSVGIDVGTTTTQIIFSRLNLSDVARPGQIPRLSITERSVLYQSPIIFTPLADRETVDAARLNEIVRREYRAAGVDYVSLNVGMDLNTIGQVLAVIGVTVVRLFCPAGPVCACGPSRRLPG